MAKSKQKQLKNSPWGSCLALDWGGPNEVEGDSWYPRFIESDKEEEEEEWH